MSDEYWMIAAEAAMEEIGLTLTDEQIKLVADVISVSHENYGMAHGHDVIQSPVDTDKDRKIGALEAEIQSLESDISIYRKSVARRRNVLESDVYLKRHRPGIGDVMIDSF